MRPFLAWSPPDYMHPYLRQGTPTFDTVDWSRMTGEGYGAGNLLIDASILAARRIEGSYTLFEPGSLVKNEPNIQIRRWNGMYLGAEKIWAGDPVRIKAGTDDVLVIYHILERISSGTSNYTNTSIILLGDTWTVKEVPSARFLPPAQPNIPVRMRQDLNFRNAVSAPFQGAAVPLGAAGQEQDGRAGQRARPLVRVEHAAAHPRLARGVCEREGDGPRGVRQQPPQPPRRKQGHERRQHAPRHARGSARRRGAAEHAAS